MPHHAGRMFATFIQWKIQTKLQVLALFLVKICVPLGIVMSLSSLKINTVLSLKGPYGVMCFSASFSENNMGVMPKLSHDVACE